MTSEVGSSLENRFRGSLKINDWKRFREAQRCNTKDGMDRGHSEKDEAHPLDPFGKDACLRSCTHGCCRLRSGRTGILFLILKKTTDPTAHIVRVRILFWRGFLFCFVFWFGFGFWFLCEDIATCFIFKSSQSTLQPICVFLFPDDNSIWFGLVGVIGLG